jgi:hypothetical protein
MEYTSSGVCKTFFYQWKKEISMVVPILIAAVAGSIVLVNACFLVVFDQLK